jgi:hypothetical protein
LTSMSCAPLNHPWFTERRKRGVEVGLGKAVTATVDYLVSHRFKENIRRN